MCILVVGVRMLLRLNSILLVWNRLGSVFGIEFLGEG